MLDSRNFCLLQTACGLQRYCVRVESMAHSCHHIIKCLIFLDVCPVRTQAWMALHFSHRPGSGRAHTLLTSAFSHRNIWGLLVRPPETHEAIPALKHAQVCQATCMLQNAW